MALFGGQIQTNFPCMIFKSCLGKFKELLEKLIGNCPPDHAITSTHSTSDLTKLLKLH